MQVRVRELPPDGFDRPRIQNVETGEIYADVSLGYAQYQPVKYNIPGDWHTTTEEGEPDYRISREVEFVIVKGSENVEN